jgi:hypothetical protein
MDEGDLGEEWICMPIQGQVSKSLREAIWTSRQGVNMNIATVSQIQAVPIPRAKLILS